MFLPSPPTLHRLSRLASGAHRWTFALASSLHPFHNPPSPFSLLHFSSIRRSVSVFGVRCFTNQQLESSLPLCGSLPLSVGRWALSVSLFFRSTFDVWRSVFGVRCSMFAFVRRPLQPFNFQRFNAPSAILSPPDKPSYLA